jgi:spore coat protein U-like protein
MKGSLKVVIVAVSMMMFATVAMAQAGSVDGNGTVEATVAGRCVLDAPFAIDFGEYDVFTNETVDLDADGSVEYRCTQGVDTHKVYVATNFGAMDRAGGGGTLDFALYSDTGRTSLFPTTFGTGLDGAGAGGVTGGYIIEIFGRVPMNQDVPAGDYSATVVVSVDW